MEFLLFLIIGLPILIIFLCSSGADRQSGSNSKRRYDYFPMHDNAFGSYEQDVLKSDGFYNDKLADDYIRYYQETYEDAMMGDEDAIMEMQDEFGDDWEGDF